MRIKKRPNSFVVRDKVLNDLENIRQFPLIAALFGNNWVSPERQRDWLYDNYTATSDKDGEDWVNYGSAVNNPHNLERVDKLLSELNEFSKCVEDLRKHLVLAYREEKKYLAKAPTRTVVVISKDGYYHGTDLTLVVGRVDTVTNEMIEILDSRRYGWAGRSAITDKMLEWHNQYGVCEYVSEDYTPTAKVLKVYAEYKGGN